MTWIVSKLAGLGDYLISLSPRTRMQIVVVGLLLLGGGASYKLIRSIQRLQDPLPIATPDQLIKPMEGLLKQTSSSVNDYRIERNRSLRKLDSLNFIYNPKKVKTDEHGYLYYSQRRGFLSGPESDAYVPGSCTPVYSHSIRNVWGWKRGTIP